MSSDLVMSCLETMHHRVCRLEADGIRGFIVGVAPGTDPSEKSHVAVVHEINDYEKTFKQAEVLQKILDCKTQKGMKAFLLRLTKPDKFDTHPKELLESSAFAPIEKSNMLLFQNILKIVRGAKNPVISEKYVEPLKYFVFIKVSPRCVPYAEAMIRDFEKYKISGV